MYCEQCGTKNEAESRFCEACGAALLASDSEPVEATPVATATRPRKPVFHLPARLPLLALSLLLVGGGILSVPLWGAGVLWGKASPTALPPTAVSQIVTVPPPSTSTALPSRMVTAPASPTAPTTLTPSVTTSMTARPTARATERPIATDTAVPTVLPTFPPQPTLPPKPVAVASGPYDFVYVRTGPGTNYPLAGQVNAGVPVDLIGRSGTWWQVCCVNGGPVWVSGDLVETRGAMNQVPVVAAPPSPVPTLTPTRVPTPIPPTQPPPTQSLPTLSPPTLPPPPTLVPTVAPPTAVPPTQPPVTSINFSADATRLTAGQCTTLHWAVEGVQAIFLNGEGVAGHDQRQVCPGATTTYTLLVQLQEGGSTTRTITLTVQSVPTAQIVPTASAPSACPRKKDGDANCDGLIDGVDYSIWLNTQCHHGANQSCPNLQADFNGDSQVDDQDYQIWKEHSRVTF